MSAVGDRRELTLLSVFEVGAILHVLEDGIVLVGMGSEEASAALLLSHLQGIDLSPLCLELCFHFCEVAGEVIVMAELSCNPPISMGNGVGFHSIIA